VTGVISGKPPRGGIGWRIVSAWTAGGGTEGGYGGIGARWGRGRFRFDGSACLFNVPDYAARYYRYEENVPGRGFSTAVWGTGASGVIVGTMGVMSIRYRTACSDLMRQERELTLQGDWTF
jgi:hypothetical protein